MNVTKRFASAMLSCLLLVFAIMMSLPPQSAAAAVGNFFNVINQDGADPWVYKHSNGYYYMTKTTGNNVTLWRSRTLTGLDAGDSKVVFTPPASGPNSKNIWAPELHWINNAWYIYYAADDGVNDNHRMFVLRNTSADPFSGTWTDLGKIYDAAHDTWAIDGTVLNVAGRLYFIWSGWPGTTNVTQNLYIAPMDTPSHISGPRVQISTPTYAWETVGTPTVNEGPEVLVKNGVISLIYSASGSWTDAYKLGQLTASTTADLLNPASWVKKSTPVFQSGNGIYGPGHCAFTKSYDGTEDWIVYHAARYQGAGWTRNIRAQKFTWNADNTPNFGIPAAPNTPIAVPSGEPLRDRYEAENGVFAGGATAVSTPTASGGAKAGYLDNNTRYVEVTVNVATAGTYVLYARTDNGTSGGPWATHSLSVNGGAAAPFYVANSGWDNWGTSTARVTLNAGANKLRFTGNTNFAEVDCLDLFPYQP
jgi:GH43 family beta-xylosidase